MKRLIPWALEKVIDRFIAIARAGIGLTEDFILMNQGGKPAMKHFEDSVFAAWVFFSDVAVKGVVVNLFHRVAINTIFC